MAWTESRGSACVEEGTQTWLPRPLSDRPPSAPEPPARDALVPRISPPGRSCSKCSESHQEKLLGSYVPAWGSSQKVVETPRPRSCVTVGKCQVKDGQKRGAERVEAFLMEESECGECEKRQMRDPESKGHEALRLQVGESRCQRAGCPLKCKGGMPGREQQGWPVFPGENRLVPICAL